MENDLSACVERSRPDDATRKLSKERPVFLPICPALPPIGGSDPILEWNPPFTPTGL